MDKEPEDKGDAFQRVLYNHRKELFRLFKSLVKVPTKVSEEEIAEVYNSFLDSVVVAMPIRYSIIGRILHIYYCYWSWSRVLYCTEWEFPCQWRPWTLVDVTGWIQALYYTLLWIPHVKIQQFVYYYGSLIMSGSLFITFFVVDSTTKWILDGSYEPTKWNVLYKPILYWMFFSFLWGRSIAISSWIWSNQRDVQVGTSEFNLPKFAISILQYTWRVVYFVMPLYGLWFYWLFKPPVLEPGLNDVLKWPNWIYLLFVDAIIGLVSGSWLSFLTFQFQFILWDKEFEEGIAILYPPDNEQEFIIGILH